MPIREGDYRVPLIGRYRALRASGFHKGFDQYGDEGTPSVLVARARILRVRYNPDGRNGFGHSVAYRHEHDGAEVIEAHFMARSKLVEGRTYEPGTVVGLRGDTGNAVRVGPHVHVEVRTRAGKLTNPSSYFKKLRKQTASSGNAGKVTNERRRRWLLG